MAYLNASTDAGKRLSAGRVARFGYGVIDATDLAKSKARLLKAHAAGRFSASDEAYLPVSGLVKPTRYIQVAKREIGKVSTGPGHAFGPMDSGTQAEFAALRLQMQADARAL